MIQQDFEIVDVEDILPFRQAMLWPDKPISHVKVAGDEDAIHICLRSNGEIVAAGTFFRSGETAQLRKLAVSPQCRGQGIGKALVSFGVDHLAKLGITRLWCDARVTAVGFYEALEFEVDADVYLKSGVAYRAASRALVFD